MPIGYPAVYSDLPGEAAGPVRHARPGRRHLGAQRARARTTSISCSSASTPTASARRCSSTRSTRCRRGLCVCVFDGTDRMQHMFWRYLDEAPSGPAGRGARRAAPTRSRTSTGGWTTSSAGRWRSAEASDTLLMVISDHGFNTFRRGIDLNRWLEENGYLDGRRRPARRGVSGRRRLVADAGVRHRADRHLHQHQGQVRAGHRRAGRGGRHSCATRSPSKLGDAGRSAERRAGDQARLPGDRRSIAGRTRTTPRT